MAKTEAEWIDVEILQIVEETTVDRSLVLGLPPDSAFLGRPGQHLFLEDRGPEPARRGAYSISSLPGETDHLEVTVRRQGELGLHFHGLEAGHPLALKGPRGRFVLESEPGQRVVLAAFGPSVAPYRAFVRERRAQGRQDPVHILHVVASEAEALFRSEHERHAGECGWIDYDLEISPTRATLATDRLEGLLTRRASTILFACGANPFVEDAAQRAKTTGLPPENIRTEKWG